MDCPSCKPAEQKGSRVIDTRTRDGASTLRRRRECLGPAKHRFTTLETVAGGDSPQGAAPTRRKVPREHEAIGHRFSIAGFEGQITAGMYEDREVGEVALGDAGESYSALGGVLAALGTAITIALQYGVPLEVIVRALSQARFEPAGITGNPEIPFAKSIPDYTVRWLASRFIEDVETLDELDVLTTEVRARRES